MKNILFYPCRTGSNTYPERMKKILSSVGNVFDLSFFKEVRYIFRRVDKYNRVAIVNWIENFPFKKNGRLSFLGGVKLLFVLFVLKINFGKVIYIRHNLYPHGLLRRNIWIAEYIISFIIRSSDVVFVHSPVHVGNGCFYLPHPLYFHPISPHRSIPIHNELRYIIFGRIERYKNLESIIDYFPEFRKLIIAGVCEDPSYGSFLEEKTADKNNICFLPFFLEDEDAENLIRKCSAMLITHASDTMLVSGSFFYALTMRKRVLAVRTPFLQWAEDTFGYSVIRTFDDLPALISYIGSEQDSGFSEYTTKDIDKINDAFSDEKIKHIFTDVV